MSTLSPEGLKILGEVAQRHGVSLETATALLDAISRGGGAQAQFNLVELGGMGQWSQGGMVMVGDMFNNGLKHRVDSLCNELSGLLRAQPARKAGVESSQSGSHGAGLFTAESREGGQWWPSELGVPSSTGAQNDMRYAFFPQIRRLAIQLSGVTRIYDTGDNVLSGFSQQQGGDQSLTFNSQHGLVRVADLQLVPSAGEGPAVSGPTAPASPRAPARPHVAAPSPQAVAPSPAPQSALAADDLLRTIERLAELRQKGVLTDQEFAAKKADLLSRL